MSKQREVRKEKQVKQEDPVNYTCGGCKRVQPFDKDNPLVCPDCNYGAI